MSINEVSFGNYKRDTHRDTQLKQVSTPKHLNLLTFKGSAPAEDLMAWHSSAIKTELIRPGEDVKLRTLPKSLLKLFEALPKAELHLHLSGSTPLPLIRDIYQEKYKQEHGSDTVMPKEELDAKSYIKPEFESLDDFLKTYYNVAWVVQEPEQFKRAAKEICKEAATENVKYIEIRTSLIKRGDRSKVEEVIKGKTKAEVDELLSYVLKDNNELTNIIKGPDADRKIKDVLTLKEVVSNCEETLRAVEDGMKEAEAELKAKKNFDQKARVIVLSQRHETPVNSMLHAIIAVKNMQTKEHPENRVVGFDVAGPEAGFPIVFHEQAIRYAKEHGLNVTIHAGETPESSYKPTDKLIPIFGDQPVSLTPAQAIDKSLEYGTDRLGHAIHLFDGTEQEVAARLDKVIKGNIAVESPPKCNIQLNSVDSYQQHPIKKMLDAGIKVNVSTDNRTISGTDSTNEFAQLYLHNIITSWNDIKKLVLNGAEAAFLPAPERDQMVDTFNKELKAMETNPEYKQAIDKYLQPALAFLGSKFNQMFNNKAA